MYTQTTTLKTLVMNTDKALWQVYSTRPEYRTTKDNPVPLLRWILGLNQDWPCLSNPPPTELLS